MISATSIVFFMTMVSATLTMSFAFPSIMVRWVWICSSVTPFDFKRFVSFDGVLATKE